MAQRNPRPPLPTALAACVAATLLGACAATPQAATPMPGSVPAAVPRGYVVDVPAIARPGGETAAWWFRQGAAQAAERGAMHGRARNVIVFLGDGMGMTTVTAARILEGQRAGRSGEENALAFERFPHTALAKTYNTNAQTPDSAGTMTAIASGAKTRIGHIGVGPGVEPGDCAGTGANTLLTLLELAESAGMATGIVTSSRLTHATPAAMYAHVPDRGWESDDSLPDGAHAAGCRDIASQFVHSPFGDGPEVALAGGWGPFVPKGMQHPEHGDVGGWRGDGSDLVSAWQQRNPEGAFAWNANQLAAAAGTSGPLLGLFSPSHLPYAEDRTQAALGLDALTRTAIARLQRHGQGFLLLVEGARIDHAHHDGNARRALSETIEFSDAVATAAAMTDAADTLVLVTADHSHTLTFAGYPRRGNPILGLVRAVGADAPARAEDGLPYTTLGYANGPGHRETREDPTHVDTTALDYLQDAGIPLGAETHGGEDVGVWASGPGASAVRGTLEQHALFHVVVQATPALRERLCAAGTCDANGVPVTLPRPADFLRPAAAVDRAAD